MQVLSRALVTGLESVDLEAEETFLSTLSEGELSADAVNTRMGKKGDYPGPAHIQRDLT